MDLQKAATSLGLPKAVIGAVVAVESGGSGFLPDGRPKVMFEEAYFDRLTGGKYRASNPDISFPKWDKKGIKSATQEWEQLNKACSLDQENALKSASWGAFQLMGNNFLQCGFDSVFHFVEAMKRDEQSQLEAFCVFMKTNNLVPFLAKLDWEGFARHYNGPRYKENQYDTKLAMAYRSKLGLQ